MGSFKVTVFQIDLVNGHEVDEGIVVLRNGKVAKFSARLRHFTGTSVGNMHTA